MRFHVLTFSTIARRLAIAAGALILTVASSGVALTAAAGSPPPVFMTTVDGTATNPASYASRDEVYLGAAACPPATQGLAAGQYYFGVTDQAGTQVLSLDRLADRLFEVGEDGSITSVLLHDFGTNQCATGPGGVVVKLQPYGLLPSGQTQYAVHVAPRASVEACPADAPFCDQAAVSTATFAIAPYAVSPSPSPSSSPSSSAAPSASPSDPGAVSPSPSGSDGASPSASASPSDSGAVSPSPSGSAPPTASPSATPAPTASANPTPQPTSRPTATPARTPAPTPAPVSGGGGGSVPNPTPTWTPYVPPSGFYICKPGEVITPTGCKTQAELASQTPPPAQGSGGPVAGGPTNPPQRGTVVGIPPTFPPTAPPAVPPSATDSTGGVAGATAGASPSATSSASPSPSSSEAPPTGSPTPSASGGPTGGSATPTLVAGNLAGGGSSTPQSSAAAAAGQAAPTPATAVDPTAAVPPTRDWNAALIVIAILAAVTIGAGSLAGRVLRKRRGAAKAR